MWQAAWQPGCVCVCVCRGCRLACPVRGMHVGHAVCEAQDVVDWVGHVGEGARISEGKVCPWVRDSLVGPSPRVASRPRAVAAVATACLLMAIAVTRFVLGTLAPACHSDLPRISDRSGVAMVRPSQPAFVACLSPARECWGPISPWLWGPRPPASRRM